MLTCVLSLVLYYDDDDDDDDDDIGFICITIRLFTHAGRKEQCIDVTPFSDNN